MWALPKYYLNDLIHKHKWHAMPQWFLKDISTLLKPTEKRKKEENVCVMSFFFVNTRFREENEKNGKNASNCSVKHPLFK